MAASKRVLIYGGRGALGNACLKYFKQQNWWVGSIDLVPNDDAHANVLVTSSESLVSQEEQVVVGVEKILSGTKLDAVICVAGGWSGGNASHDDFVKNTDLMLKQSVWSSVIASKLAAKYLNNDGFLALTGAKAALEPTPGMIGYGLAKSAVHHLTKSLAADKSGLPSGVTVLAILPETLDTPMNRKFMPKSDFSSWTPLDFVAGIMYNWSSSPGTRPENGSLVQLVTRNGETTMVPFK